MTKEDLQAVAKAITIIIDKCDNRKIIIEPLIGDCTGCKWEHDNFAEECNMCSRIRVDNYEKDDRK